jgi:DNA-binding NarL/FixJ family response regulator
VPPSPGYSFQEEILVALVDDNRLSREEHAKLLNATPGVSVISAEATLNLTMLTDEQPDVVLVDPGSSEIIALRTAVTAGTSSPTLAWSSRTSWSTVRTSPTT